MGHLPKRVQAQNGARPKRGKGARLSAISGAQETLSQSSDAQYGTTSMMFASLTLALSFLVIPPLLPSGMRMLTLYFAY